MQIYLITNQINNKQYIGAEKGNDSKYFGSGKLIGEAIEKFGKKNFRKDILIDDKYIDNWKKCLELESVCILSFNTLQPNGYNVIWWNWPFPVEICRKAGKKQAELKIGMFASGMQSKAGKRGIEKTNRIIAERRKNDSNYDRIFRARMRELGKRGGRKQVESKTNFWDPANKEKMKERGIKGAKNSAHTLFEIDGLIQRTTLGAINA